MANDSFGLPRRHGEGGSPRRFGGGFNLTNTDKAPTKFSAVAQLRWRLASFNCLVCKSENSGKPIMLPEGLFALAQCCIPHATIFQRFFNTGPRSWSHV